MAFKTPKQTSNYTLAPAGTHIGRCIGLIDMGTHDDEWEGKARKSRKVRVRFELPTELHVFDEQRGEEPFTISREFSWSMGDRANFRKFVEGWTGKKFKDQDEACEFDLTKLVSKPCIVAIGHKPKKSGGGEFAELMSASPLMKGQVCPPCINQPLIYQIEEGEGGAFKELHEKIREKIMESDEWKARTAGNSTGDNNDTPPDDDDVNIND